MLPNYVHIPSSLKMKLLMHGRLHPQPHNQMFDVVMFSPFLSFAVVFRGVYSRCFSSVVMTCNCHAELERVAGLMQQVSDALVFIVSTVVGRGQYEQGTQTPRGQNTRSRLSC